MAASIKTVMAAFFNWKMLFFVSAFIFWSASMTEGARLSDPKILLPYQSSVVTNFTLKINLTREESKTPSCYTW